MFLRRCATAGELVRQRLVNNVAPLNVEPQSMANALRSQMVAGGRRPHVWTFAHLFQPFKAPGGFRSSYSVRYDCGVVPRLLNLCDVAPLKKGTPTDGRRPAFPNVCRRQSPSCIAFKAVEVLHSSVGMAKRLSPACFSSVFASLKLHTPVLQR
mmetsp:Transcript_33311/g.89169  ORF Transcript_33311/g.89169 Transcript_33311/m.89169 type:complete len:154 (-) Transcript_33311:34-495(-)